MIIEIIKSSIFITVSVIGSFLVFGLLIGFIGGKTNMNLIRTFGSKSIIATNFIGTTIHEFSHYIMCKIFFHKVNEVKLFSFKVNESGILGEVTHSYNKNSLYQRVGNFFIGVAPIFVGAIVLILSLRFLLPESFVSIMEGKSLTDFVNNIQYTSIGNYIEMIMNIFKNFIRYIFTVNNLQNMKFWIFIIIAFSISTHMSLSKADLKNSKDGVFAIFIISIVVSLFIYFFSSVFNVVLSILLIFNSLLIAIMSVGLFFNLVSYGITKIIFIILKK